MVSIINSRALLTFILFGSLFIVPALGWGSSDKIRLTDVNVVTLHQGRMTNSRRTHPVPQLKCVGGSAGCSAFNPSAVQCYNRGSDGYDVQWECKADMDSQYRFGEIAVNCEGYDYPDDPYVLKGSCGLEYTIDVVDHGGHHQHGGHYHHHDNYHSGHRHSGHHWNHYTRNCGSWFGTIITWGVIAWVVYYIYQRLIHNPTQQNNSTGGFTQSGPPPPGFRPEYVPGDHTTHSSSNTGNASAGAGTGFWSGAATGGLLGYLFGSSGRRSPYYADHGYYGPSYRQRQPGYGFGGSNWFGSNNSWSSGWTSGSSHRRSSPSPPSTRTASGFGGTKRR
ncbi:hypothetical protein ACROYT_G043500 [Oculina patagonica]